MKVKLWMRATAFLVAAQFLNVQINAAMGNQAMAAMTPEYQAAMSQAESKLSGFLDGMTEEAQWSFVYKMYKVGVKARNKVSKMSDEKFEKRLARVTKTEGRPEDAAPTMEETELAQEVNGIEELGEFQNAFAGTDNIGTTPIMTSKTQFLNQVDPILSTLGSTQKANGKFSIAKKSEFKKNLIEWNKKQNGNEVRSPASSSLVKLLLKILIITVSVIAIAITISLVLIFISTAITWLFVALVVTGAVLIGVNVNIRL
jgi:hypothetical protein